MGLVYNIAEAVSLDTFATKSLSFAAFARGLMRFVCIYIPNFIFQAAARAEAELRFRPAAMVEGETLVAAANSAALKAGVEPGMTAIQAA